ncbi:MAG TPA: zinc ribbon domain-containing protein, partial [Pyrinomonadaceae bacterium]|nr:zinc ribbon domain-containing protein [Pyrinomonadaceae bacterium]
MFCPNCGQQQTSDETRFCSRCGFQLGVVKAVLAAGEAAGEVAVVRGEDPARRNKDLTLGVALMFALALLVAAVTVELPPGHSNRIINLVVAWLVLTLLVNLRPLLRYFFGGAGPAGAKADGARLGRAPVDAALPPAFETAAAPAAPPAQSDQIGVNGFFSVDPAQQGATFQGAIVMGIPRGLHVNSNRPLGKYAVP